MLARESSAKLKPFHVAALGGKVTWTALATASPSVENEKSTGFASTEARFDVGAEDPVDCTVVGRQVDPADFVRRLIRVPAGADGKLETVAAAVDHRPYLRVTSLFTWGPKGSKTVAAPKIAVVPMHDATFVCVHDEPGYEKTFARVVASAVKSLEPYGEGPAPRYREIQQATLGGVKVGAAIDRAYDRKDGKREETDLMAILVFGRGKVHSKDVAVVDVTDKSGALVSETVVGSDDGRLATKLLTTRTAPGHYLVQGKLDGKDTKTRLTAKHRLTIEATRARLLRSVAQGKVATATFDELDASVSPAKIETWTAKRLHGRKLLLSTGNEAEKCELDAAGLCSSVETTKGPASGLVVRRVDASGTP